MKDQDDAGRHLRTDEEMDAETARQLLNDHAHEPDEEEIEIVLDLERPPGTEEEEREQLLLTIAIDEKRGDPTHAEWCRHRLANLHGIWLRHES